MPFEKNGFILLRVSVGAAFGVIVGGEWNFSISLTNDEVEDNL